MFLVTGAGGFLGHFVTRVLMQCGVPFRGLVRVTDHRSFPFEAIRGRLDDAASLREAIRGATGVIHLASTLSNDPQIVLRHDIEGMHALLDAWTGGPVVFASSMDVYPWHHEGALDEESALEPASWYALGKQTCEQILGLHARLRRLPHVVLRLPYVIGMHDRVPTSVFGRMIGRALAGQDLIVPRASSGTSWVSAVYVARAMHAAVTDPRSGVYNIASGWTTWSDAARLIIAASRSASRTIDADQPGDTPRPGGRRLNTDKLRDTYRLVPDSTIEDELCAVVGFMRDPGAT